MQFFHFGKRIESQPTPPVLPELTAPSVLAISMMPLISSTASVIHTDCNRAKAYDIEEIEHSGLFDVDFYLMQASDANDYPGGVSAHFLEIGAKAGLSPHRLFDSQYYLKNNPDLTAKGVNPLIHFILSGAANGASPHPLFDVAFYFNSYPEVAKSGINPLLHFLKVGVVEDANPHPLFDTSFYKGQNPAGLGWNENPLLHFLENCPAISQVSPHPLFDVPFYLSSNQEVAELGLNPLLHYVMSGAFSGLAPHPLFDPSFYLEQIPEELTKGESPLAHFLRQGAQNKLNPHPLFDVSFYLQMNPHVAKHGMNALCHYVRFGAAEQLDPSPFFDNAFYSETYGAEYKYGTDPLTHYLTIGAKSGYNPSLLFDNQFYIETNLQPKSQQENPDFCNPLVHFVKNSRLEQLITRDPEAEQAILDGEPSKFGSENDPASESSYDRFFKAIARPCKHLFLLGCLMRGGAERSACHCIRLAAEKAGNLEDVLVVVTDASNVTCAEWLPVGTRLVNMAELQTKVSPNDKGSLITRLLSATGAETVHLFNSPRAYAALAYYFDHYPRPLCKIYTYLCGYEIYADRNFNGFSDGPLNLAARYLDLIITDNNRLCQTVKERYKHVDSIDTKAVTCYQPLTTALHLELSSPQSRQLAPIEIPKVIWASRLDATKRPDILFKIAQCLPEIQFDVYGYSSSGHDFNYLRKLKNIKLMGEYSDFSQIPKNERAIFVYTSDADGMPNVLLEAAASGFPIIAPDVGGVRELITDNSGWLVRKFDDVAEYVRLLKCVLANPDEANERCHSARAMLKERHSWTAFSNRLVDLGVV